MKLNFIDTLSEAIGNSDGQTPDEIRKELSEEGVDVKGIEKRLNEFQKRISAYKQEDDENVWDVLEWYWLFQDGNDIAGYYYDLDSDIPISDEGLEEAECITSEAWIRFEKAAEGMRNEISNRD